MKKINEVSKLVGVSRRTLQYYDDEGIVVAKRGENNHRIYDQVALEQIWRIMIYKEMGIDLEEIKKILQLTEVEQKEFLEQRKKQLKEQIEKVEDQMEFISLVIREGLPQIPKVNEGITYIDAITELRKGQSK